MKVAKSTVYYAVNMFKELSTCKDRPRNGRPRTARSKKVIKAVRERVRRNPKESATQMAKKRGLIKNHVHKQSSVVAIPKEKHNTSHLLKSTRDLKEQVFFLEN